MFKKLNFNNWFSKKKAGMGPKEILGLLLLIVMAIACAKTNGNEPVDPKIAEANQAAKDFRAAFVPAKTIEYDIGDDFDRKFNDRAKSLGLSIINLVDSADIAAVIAGNYAEGGPYSNPVTMRTLQERAIAVQKLKEYYK